ncbi:hypothetical protein NC315_07445 [Streptomyces sp. G2]|uniref:hypothetical protein n=1 Tax=Streptomyces sp. G2 TaxID=1684471 RepID=UPI0020309EA8|nr:hypothetical protein [Streptomyces sp. G2]MCM1945210.1 hypothetical protein [Streptomyces sp. G2]
MITDELARKEHRPQSEISLEISRQFIDVTDLRAEDESIHEGTISIHAGMGLISSANQMMVSAAAATLRRQGYYGKSMPREAYKHARRMRLGQTRAGSYIIPIISSARFGSLVTTSSDETRLDVAADETYFERRMLTTLSHALETLSELAIERSRIPSKDDVLDAVDEGVSSELCSAILDVIGHGEVSEFDVAFNWAPSSPAPRSVADRIVFLGEAAPVIEHIRGELKDAKAQDERVLYGVIRRLALKRNETVGHVAMDTVIDGKPRVVAFDLPLDVYSRAARYHGERRPVVVRGILDVTPGKQATMLVHAFDADRSVESFDDVVQ